MFLQFDCFIYYFTNGSKGINQNIKISKCVVYVQREYHRIKYITMSQANEFRTVKVTQKRFTVLNFCQIQWLRRGSHSDWTNGKTFSSQGILHRLETSRKITHNTGSQGISDVDTVEGVCNGFLALYTFFWFPEFSGYHQWQQESQ